MQNTEMKTKRRDLNVARNSRNRKIPGLQMVDGKIFAAAAPRTIQLDLIALRICLKQAIEAGHLRGLPRFPKSFAMWPGLWG
jgi:hypothetical protein